MTAGLGAPTRGRALTARVGASHWAVRDGGKAWDVPRSARIRCSSNRERVWPFTSQAPADRGQPVPRSWQILTGSRPAARAVSWCRAPAFEARSQGMGIAVRMGPRPVQGLLMTHARPRSGLGASKNREEKTWHEAWADSRLRMFRATWLA